ncbi:increased loss of mitochondrial DNA protein 1 [Diplogelasinospora grovesii]|uniref:Increased loss of mitochondrial DNA protein 1 n=1 Tax=Diplogelasinospora grovesii TaxID=303347 RepID=A0AAN6N934_9PEZI|nr:increased loss of mitochondrial DNA protein 1 [Diplogelasinospora grovesii]
MALISGKTILTSLCLFHITLGFFFLTSPGTVADQAVVYLLGEAMGLPAVLSFDTQNPALAFLGIILGFIGISDLVTLSLPEEISLLHHWSMQAPLRLFMSFMLVLYTFFFSASSPLYAPPSSSSASTPDGSTSRNTGGGGSGSSSFMAHPSAHAHNPAYVPSGWGGDALKNRVFFAFMFVETISWFWVWVTLQEERRDLLLRAQRKQQRRRSSHGLSH